jgi:putative nucleotidyltransferase with HDIG domain
MGPWNRGSLFSSAWRGRLAAVVVLLGIPLALFAILTVAPQLDVLFESVRFHLIVISAIAASAVGVATFAAVAAMRSRSAPMVFVALGCVSVAVLMLGHGLTTPGVMSTPRNLWVARFPVLAVGAFALWQAAAVVEARRSLPTLVARHPWAALIAPTSIMLALTGFVVASPTTGHGAAPIPGEDALLNVLSLASAVALVAVGAVHWRRWGLSRDKVQFALVLACWAAAEAELSLHFGRLWHLSWWDYHALLLAGFGMAVYAIVLGYLRTRDTSQGLAQAFDRDPLDHIARGYPEALRALVAAVEARDAYTAGHSDRVSQLSVQMGQRLGLQSGKLRRLAWGTLLHDIGKIGIPDRILLKEGTLTQEERALIEEHPIIGWEIARQVHSLREILDILLHHHERVDGNGYPHQLKGEEISLNARIVSVADVWDALTSARSYRPAFSVQRALEIMIEGRGTQFDAACLDAFLQVMAERGIVPGQNRARPQVAVSG